MQKVNLMINGENIKINASKVFSGMNPRTLKHYVYIMDDDTGKQVRLFCKNLEEATASVQQIRSGEISDLTGYPADWN